MDKQIIGRQKDRLTDLDRYAYGTPGNQKILATCTE